MNSYGFSNEEIHWALRRCPKLISIDVKTKLEEFCFIFELYNGLNKRDVSEIIKEFPFALLNNTWKMKEFAGQFKKYKLTKK